MSGSDGCFFLDTTVVLSDIFQESTRTFRVEKFKRDLRLYNVPCYVSVSVKEEIYEKVQETSDFLGDQVRKTISHGLEDSRGKRKIQITKPIDSNDVKALETLFSYYHAYMKKTKNGFPLPSPIVSIEEWCIGFLEEKLGEVTFDAKQFLRELVKKLLELTGSFEDSYYNLLEFQKGYLKVDEVSPDASTIERLESKGIHHPDSVHLASAIAHRNISKQRTIFVTFDYSTILANRRHLWNSFKIESSDPLYAVHYLA